jgi:sulfur carrier protein ThiS adenylyltransferase
MHYQEIKNRLRNKVVGIAGCGGLGSNSAVALVRTGVINLVLADFDIIHESNLNRQYYFINQVGRKKVYALRDNLMAINPDINVEVFDTRLDEDNLLMIFKNCDLVIEAFDEASQKHMLIETFSREMPGKYVISGVGLAGFGNNNAIKTSKFGNIYICGDNISEVSDVNPPLAPRVGIVACMQANQALEILLINDDR